MRPENEFDWNNEGAIAVSQQAAITVVSDQRGNIVIRQAGQYGPEDDTSVVLAPENARALAEAIMREAAVEPVRPLPAEKSTKPMTNAERQRAYRQRQRNAAVTPPVTEHNAERNGSAHAPDPIGGLTTDKIDGRKYTSPARTHPISSEGDR